MKIPTRRIALLLLLCTGCQMGILPCPKIKEAKLHTRYRYSSTAFSARANQEQSENTQAQRNKDPRVANTRFIDNVSVTEWDCPHPGRKHYLPKAIKDNIRKNMDKIKSDLKKD